MINYKLRKNKKKNKHIKKQTKNNLFLLNYHIKIDINSFLI